MRDWIILKITGHALSTSRTLFFLVFISSVGNAMMHSFQTIKKEYGISPQFLFPPSTPGKNRKQKKKKMVWPSEAITCTFLLRSLVGKLERKKKGCGYTYQKLVRVKPWFYFRNEKWFIISLALGDFVKLVIPVDSDFNSFRLVGRAWLRCQWDSRFFQTLPNLWFISSNRISIVSFIYFQMTYFTEIDWI